MIIPRDAPMTIPPNPFTDSAVGDAAADTAAVSLASQGDAAANAIAESSTSTGGPEETPAVIAAPTAGDSYAFDPDGVDCIGEIFHVARKLLEDDRRRRFELNEQAFMDAVDEPLPLFLREKR
jgi:hypothetical protein